MRTIVPIVFALVMWMTGIVVWELKSADAVTNVVAQPPTVLAFQNEIAALKTENARLKRELNAAADRCLEERKKLVLMAQDSARLEALAQQRVGRLGESNVLLLKKLKEKEAK